jgi:hypothetical protein
MNCYLNTMSWNAAAFTGCFTIASHKRETPHKADTQFLFGIKFAVGRTTVQAARRRLLTAQARIEFSQTLWDLWWTKNM